MRRFALAVLMSTLGFSLTARQGSAQSDEEIAAHFLRRSHTFENFTLPYRLFVPESYDPAMSYPLVLALHGAGSRGSDNDIHILNQPLATSWAHPNNQSEHPAFVVAPQVPSGGRWTNVGIDPQRGFVFLDPIRREMATVMELLGSVETEFSIDSERIYVTGLSMGGHGTWDIVRRFPGRFAAAIPMSGVGEAISARRIKDIPIWAFHGELDNIVTVEGSRSMIEDLTALGHQPVFTDCDLEGTCEIMPDCLVRSVVFSRMPLLYTEYQNAGHNVWRESYENPNLIDWTFLQNRQDRAGPIGRFQTTFQVDMTAVVQQRPELDWIGVVGNEWPLETGVVLPGCDPDRDDIYAARVRFPANSSGSQLDYRFAYSMEGGPVAEIELVGRSLTLEGVDSVLSVVVWNSDAADLERVGSTVPHSFSLENDGPHPANHRTGFIYDVPRSTHVRLTAYDLQGRRVGTLVDGAHAAGTYRVVWNTAAVPSGLYVCMLSADSHTTASAVLVVH